MSACTVLVVDDMAIVREPIAAALRARGYRTVMAANGREAMGLLRSQRPDLVLLDLAMPEFDGLSFLKALARDPHACGLPVIVLSAVKEKSYIVQAARLGVRDFLLKSQFSLEELFARIERKLAEVGHAPGAATKASGPRQAEAPTGEPPASESEQPAAAEPAADAPAAPAAGPVASPRPSDPVEELKGLKPLVTRSEILAHADACGELKAFSPTVTQLLSLTGSPQCSIDSVERVVRQDQAIALKILKLANSVVYTRGEPVDSVRTAVMRIGLSQLRQVVMNLSVIDRFSSKQLGEHLSAPLFWEHSIATGLIAAQLTRGRGGTEPEVDAAFTMGLLHDVGRVVYAERLGEQYAEVMRTAEALALPLEQVESRLLLVNHADLMDRLLHAWRFPAELINPIALHHLSVGNMRRMSPRSLTEGATLALADCLAHALLLGCGGNLTIYPVGELVQALRLEDPAVAEIERVIPRQCEDMKFALLARSRQEGWPAVREQVRGSLPRAINPLFVGRAPGCDSYRIFCDQIAEGGDGKPNLAVAHLAGVRERAELSETLQRAEREASAPGLPLLVISPHAALTLEERVLAGRRVERVPSPLPLSRFSEAVGRLLGAA